MMDMLGILPTAVLPLLREVCRANPTLTISTRYTSNSLYWSQLGSSSFVNKGRLGWTRTCPPLYLQSGALSDRHMKMEVTTNQLQPISGNKLYDSTSVKPTMGTYEMTE